MDPNPCSFGPLDPHQDLLARYTGSASQRYQIRIQIRYPEYRTDPRIRIRTKMS
jgi:hypothetical protein